ncbi:MAG: pantoate--beta-alanine ligase [Pseudonocardia sp.]
MTPPVSRGYTPGELTVHTDPAGLTAVSSTLRAAGRKVALVPTMGALHEGHVELVRHARRAPGATVTAVSIFVNPLQFGPAEDLDRYPRTLEADLERCRGAGVELVFTPPVEAVYPPGHTDIRLDPGPLGAELEGAVRPGHFQGVLTVVAKLFGIVRPQLAYFGEKDYQQLVLIRRMAHQLNLGVEVIGVPTVREPDGLAMSSRNAYLEPDQRRRAPVVSMALTAARDAARHGADAVLDAAHQVLAADPGLAVDYLELRDPELGPAPEQGLARLLVAAQLGNTRLLDNIGLTLKGAPPGRY